MIGYLYILKCVDGSYYIGSTQNLLKRIKEHQDGVGSNYTSRRLPVELVYCEEFNRIDSAYHREKQIQKWTKAKKEALVTSNISNLSSLAKKVFKNI